MQPDISVSKQVPTYPIEKGVPIPPRRLLSPFTGMLRQLEIGDCLLVTGGGSIHSKASVYAKAAGIKITCRKVGEDTCRVWRIA